MIELNELQEYVALCEQISAERERVCRTIATVEPFQKDCFKDITEIEKGNHPQEYRPRSLEFSLVDFLALHKRRYEIEKHMRDSGLGSLIVKAPAIVPPTK